MKIRKVSIHNFRSIIDATFEMRDYTLVIGANNAGKSSVIDAIRYFYEADKESKFSYEEDFPKSGAVDEEVWVEITYQLTHEENISLKKEYQSDDCQLTLRKYLKADSKGRVGIIFFQGKDGTLSQNSFYGAKNVQDGKIGDVVYIPALSRVEDQVKFTGPSVLRDLISKIFESVVEGSEPYQRLCSQVANFSDEIATLETEDHKSIRGFEQGFSDCFQSWGTQFALDIKMPKVAEIVKNMVSWHLQDKKLNAEQDIERYGSGFQRHFIYSLIRLSAEYLPQRKKNKTKDFVPEFTLILFEEPEAFLHPQQQDDLARSLRKIGSGEAWQVLCTSHSPHFVSHNTVDLPSIVRVQKKDNISQIFQIKDGPLQRMLDEKFDENLYPSLAQKYNSGIDPDMESMKFVVALNPYRAGAFFADKVLLVEGTTEQAFINRLIDDEAIQCPVGSFVLECIGKFNIFKFMWVLSELGIVHSVLHDADNPQKAEQREWNQRIQTAKTALTATIKVLPDDIEGFLGVKKPDIGSIKPQSLLMHYLHGEIQETKLVQFKELLSELL